MHEMQKIVTDDLGVCLSVSLSVCHAAQLSFDCAKMAEQIKMLFGVNTRGGLRNMVLDGGPNSEFPYSEERGIRCSLRQITLSSCSNLQFQKSNL